MVRNTQVGKVQVEGPKLGTSYQEEVEGYRLGRGVQGGLPGADLEVDLR
jgi:hypothetical protein